MAIVLDQLLTESARRYPNRQAISDGDRVVTYAQLDATTNQIARQLIRIGAGRNARIGILMPRGLESVAAALAVLKTGGTYVPIDPLTPASRLRFVAEKCKLLTIITLPALVGLVGGSFVRGLPFEELVIAADTTNEWQTAESPRLRAWLTNTERDHEDVSVQGRTDTDLAYILFTSGSTGTPKGVAVSHRNALTFVESAGDLFQITPDDRLSNVCPLHFDMSVFDIYVAVRAGACVVSIPEQTAMFPVQLAKAISDGRISVWNSVPSSIGLLTELEDLERHDFTRLRLVLFAGEVFAPPLLKRLQLAIANARFCNMYGQTEANSSTYFWLADPASRLDEPLPIGRPLPNYDVYAVDERGTVVVEPGQRGELYVRGSAVAAGYWDEPELTATAFVDDPLLPGLRQGVYKTGDLVRMDRDGNYVFVGRKDLMVKRRGYRIEIEEIEAILRGHPAIRNAAALTVPDSRVGNRIVVIVQLVTAGSLRADEVIAFCASELPRYTVPDEVRFQDTVPMTSSGKVDRARLRA